MNKEQNVEFMRIPEQSEPLWGYKWGAKIDVGKP
jgi:hypothetical protein